MLFKRQKLLLTLLDALGEPTGHTDFQKLLFLFAQECGDDPAYEFVPYRFGGFSFTSYADKRKLIEKGTLSKACAGVGIRYEHFRELGIESDKRQTLVTHADSDALFDAYERTTLSNQTEALDTILVLDCNG